MRWRRVDWLINRGALPRTVTPPPAAPSKASSPTSPANNRGRARGPVMSDLLAFVCPHCGQNYPVTPEQIERHAGETINCKKCSQAFTLPAIDTVDFKRNPEIVNDPTPVSPLVDAEKPRD